MAKCLTQHGDKTAPYQDRTGDLSLSAIEVDYETNALPTELTEPVTLESLFKFVYIGFRQQETFMTLSG